MKKRKLLLVVPAMGMLALTSCFKNKIDPITDKNSSVQLGIIKFKDLIVNSSTSVKCYARFNFYTANGTTSDITDTVKFIDSFIVANPLDHTQTYNFDTPDKTKKISFDVSFKVEGGGQATGVNVTDFVYKLNGQTLLETPFNFSTIDGKVFTMLPKVINL